LCEALHGSGNGDPAFDDWKGENKRRRKKGESIKKDAIKIKGAC
jgi:hypothetical protein